MSDTGSSWPVTTTFLQRDPSKYSALANLKLSGAAVLVMVLCLVCLLLPHAFTNVVSQDSGDQVEFGVHDS